MISSQVVSVRLEYNYPTGYISITFCEVFQFSSVASFYDCKISDNNYLRVILRVGQHNQRYMAKDTIYSFIIVLRGLG